MATALETLPMTPSHDSNVPTLRCPSSWLFRGIFLLIAACTLSVSLPAQKGSKPSNQDDRRHTLNPADIQDRMLGALREQFGVTDDAEWAVIAERVMKVSELRRSTTGSIFSSRGSSSPGATDDKGKRSYRPSGAGNPEQDALRTALKDQLPDAEIKARLTRLRETRKQNEAKLAMAQEELRAVLSIRQEAVAVIYGLLP